MYKILFRRVPFGIWMIKQDEKGEKTFETIEEAKREVEAMIKDGERATCIRIIQEFPFDVEVK